MQKWCPYKSLFLSICPSVCLSFRETFEISLCHTSMTWFYSCHRKYIFCHKIYSFFHRKNPSVTDNHTPFVTGGILSFTWSFSCDMCIFHHVTQNIPPITRSIVCITWRIFLVTGIILHSASSQEIFFLWDKVIIFSCDTSCTSFKRICCHSCNEYSFFVYLQYFPVTRTIICCEKIVF